MNFSKKSLPPKVSVIIPVYGVEKYIERCARSLFEQTLDDVEYLFIDDCTPDRSIELLKQVLEKYPQRKPQVVFHRMEKNSGQAAVRKWGMQNATGEYVTHCDSDDWVDKDLYKRMYENAVILGAEVSICDYIATDGNKIIYKAKGCGTLDRDGLIARQLLQKDPWSLCNKLFLRSVCYKDLVYPMSNMGEDMMLCTQLMMRCETIAYTPHLFYYYYCNENSISNKKNKSIYIKNYESLKSNTDTLLDILKYKKIPHKKWIFNYLQYNATITLLHVIHGDKKCRYLWMNAYPGANWLFLFNPYVRFSERIKVLMAIVGLYPFKKDRVTNE